MNKELYLGIDMGGTQIKIAVVDSAGRIVEESAIDTDIKAEPSAVIKRIACKVQSLKNYQKVRGIGFGVAGDINCDKGLVRFSPNLPKWKNVPLKKEMEKLTCKKVYVDNDANTASVGAFWLDAKGRTENLVCVTLGTGVGGGLILDGKLYRGRTCTAGEIGHITIDRCGKKCKCGNTGCVETYIGAKYLSEYARKYFEKHKSPVIDKLTDKDKIKITPKILHAAAVKGDKGAVEIWNCAGEKLGILLALVLNFINPDMIVLCGGVSHAGKYLLDPAVKEAQKRAFKSAFKACKSVISRYTGKLGVVGAAMLPRQ